MLENIYKNLGNENIKVDSSSDSIFIHITTKDYKKLILKLKNGLVFETLTPIP